MASGSHSAVTSGPALESALGALLQAWPAHAIEPALTHLVATCLKSQVVSDDRLIELERAHAEMQARRLALESALPVQSGSMRAAVATIRQAAFDGSVSPQLEEAWSQVQTVALPLICQAKIRRGTNVRGEKIDKAKLESQSLALAAWLKDASNPMSPPPSRYLAGDEMCGRDRYPGFSALSVPPRRDLVRLWLSELLAMGDAFSRESYTPLTVHILLVEMDLQRQLRHHQLGIDSSLSSTSGRVISLLPLEQPIQREAADAWVSDLCRTGRVDARPKVVLGCMSVHLGPNGQGIWTAYQLDDSAMEATLYSWDHGYEITDRTRDILRPLVERLIRGSGDSSDWQYYCVRPRRLSPEHYRHSGQISIQAISILLSDSIVPPQVSRELGEYLDEEDFIALQSRQIDWLLDDRESAIELYRDIQFGDRLLDRLISPYDS